MNVKIDTKEKFTVITPISAIITANMTDEWKDKLLEHSEKQVPHIILNFKNVESIQDKAIENIAQLQAAFYEKNCSFVACCLASRAIADGQGLETWEDMNVTATESEAWDIVQMEEIERELLADEDGAL